MGYDAIYTRQSVDRAESISVESQAELCRRELTDERYQIYSDKGYSGKNTDRPAFQQLLRHIEEGKVRRVIVYRLDRISRSVLDFAGLIEIFQRHGVEFVSTVEKFDTATPIGKAMLMIVMIFAQLERETIQQRVADAYRSRSRRGFYMGGRVPYGFALSEETIDGIPTKKFTPIPEEAAVIKTIYGLYEKPEVSLGEVARSLAKRQITNREGRPFTPSAIRALLLRPAYVKADRSVWAFFKSQGAVVEEPPESFIGTNGAYLYASGGGRCTAASPAGQTLVLAPHEGLVPSEIWLRCRRKCLNDRKKKGAVKVSWLAGKLKCGYCGYALSLKTYRCKTKADNRYYLCSSHRAVPCPFRSLNADGLDAAVLGVLRERLGAFPTLSKAAPPKSDARLISLQVELEAVEGEISQLMEKLAKADETLSEYITRRIWDLDAKKRELTVQLHPKKEAAQGAVLQNYMDHWEELSLLDRRGVLDCLIESIHATDELIEVRWRF